MPQNNHLAPLHTLENLTPIDGLDLVTLAEAKAHLRVDFDDDDNLIGLLIQAAAAMLNGDGGLCGFPITQQQFKYVFNGVYGVGSEGFYLPITPAIDLHEIKYYNTSNVLVTANLADWELIANNTWALVRPKSLIWPSLYNRWDAFSITWHAGRVDLPEIKHAMLLCISAFYENRGDAEFEIPKAAQSLINLKRKGWVG